LAIVRVDFSSQRPAGFADALARSINTTMQSVLGVPPSENYVVCQEHAAGAVLHAPGDCPPERLDQLVFIQITLNQGRSAELKTDFYRKLTQALVATGYVRAENVFINLVEVARENWSFGSVLA
jgi:4-oxalocrotonate tautomerase